MSGLWLETDPKLPMPTPLHQTCTTPATMTVTRRHNRLVIGKQMRLLITGGAGFIGSNLVKLALDGGAEVTVLDDLSTGHRANVDGLDVTFVEGSVLDAESVRQSLSGVDAVIHLAALGSVPRSIEDPLRSHAANATGTLTILDQARQAGIKHFVVSSSSSVYGMNPALPKAEREWVRPMSPYAVSKLAAEQYVLAYQQSYGMTTLAFRFFNVYGPGQRSGHAYAAVIPEFMDALLSRRPMPVHGDGTQSRDFTYVGTVCRVLLESAVRRVSYPEPVNLAYGSNTTLNDLIETISRVAGRRPSVQFTDPRPGDVKHSQADNRALLSLFPEIEPVPLEQGLAATLNWLEGMK